MAVKDFKVKEVQRSDDYDSITIEGRGNLEIYAEKGEEGYLFKWNNGDSTREYRGYDRGNLIDSIAEDSKLSRLGAESLIGTVLHHLEPGNDEVKLQ